MNHSATSSILADRTSVNQAIRARYPSWRLPEAQTWRSVSDIIFDWIAIFVCVWTVGRIGLWVTPIAFVVIGNRQRALGNLLHEVSHGNLSPHRHVNDYLAHLLLAAPLLNSLRVYRELHARHHAWLGDQQHDPDWLSPPPPSEDQWYHVYMRCLTTYPVVRGSLLGHFSGGQLTARLRFGILAWWTIFTLLMATANLHFAMLFLSLWFGARITVFHAITTFREMTDHYGLMPGGIFSFTREIPDHGVLSLLFHPHHNGYHLTHHLFPAVPYHQLPGLHEQLMELPEYRDRAHVCQAYANGSASAVVGWGACHE
jgi:fatty acid desaturase